MHQSFETPHHPPQAWQEHSLSASVKASEVPTHGGKDILSEVPASGYSAVQTKVLNVRSNKASSTIKK